MREDLNSILQALFKSPAVWVAAITLAHELQTWLLPNIPDGVVSAVNLLIIAVAGAFGIALSSYQAGKIAQQRAYQRAAQAKLGTMREG